jgi:hypothetical protein
VIELTAAFSVWLFELGVGGGVLAELLEAQAHTAALRRAKNSNQSTPLCRLELISQLDA